MACAAVSRYSGPGARDSPSPRKHKDDGVFFFSHFVFPYKTLYCREGIGRVQTVQLCTLQKRSVHICSGWIRCQLLEINSTCATGHRCPHWPRRADDVTQVGGARLYPTALSSCLSSGFREHLHPGLIQLVALKSRVSMKQLVSKLPF